MADETYRVTLKDGRTFNVTTPGGAPSESDVMTYLASNPGAGEMPKPAAPAPQSKADWLKSRLDPIDAEYRAKDIPLSVDALPMAGGALFSLAGGGKRTPVGAGLAALGGAAGEGARQVIRSIQGRPGEVPETAMGRIKAMAIEGGKQGGIEAVGRAATPVLQAAGNAAYKAALRPSLALTRKYGDLVSKGVERAIPVSGRAVEPTRTAMIASKNEARAAATGVPIPATNVVRGLKPVGQELSTQVRAGMADARPELVGQIRQFQAKNPAVIPGEQLAELKHARDMAADAAFRAEAKGAQPSATGLLNEGFSSAMGGALEQAVPGIRAINANTRDLFGMSRALEDAANRGHGLTNLFSAAAGVGGAVGTPGGYKERGGAGLGGAAAVQALGSPYVQSIGGIGLNRASRLPYAQLVRLALIAGLTGATPGQQ